MKKFNQKDYINNYQREHYSIFKVKLKKEEKKELDDLLNNANINQAQFLRNAINDLKAKMKDEDK